jgi:cysteine synthase A
MKSLIELIGNTPIVELKSLHKGNHAHIFAKLEYFNPAGSVKDRVAAALIADAENRGLLTKGGTIVEPTSGNTGIGLAMVSAVKGYRLVLTMPESMSMERRQLLAALGAEIVLTPAAEGMNGAVAEAEKIRAKTKNAISLGQFSNIANPNAHYVTTGPEIWNQMDGKVDVFVAGVGTGGTISGVGLYLKERNKSVKIVAVQPSESPVLSGGAPGPHKIQGIGANFIPKNYNPKIVDTIFGVPYEQAVETCRRIAKSEGLLVGVSSGAAACAALKIAEMPSSKGKNIVVVFPDGGERYLSTGLY